MLPALYIGHGAPLLLEHAQWMGELADLAAGIDRPKAILIVSAHWETAPLMIGAVTEQPLIYDFYGFPTKYYNLQYRSPGAPALAAQVKQLLSGIEQVADAPSRGLDHGAYVPLLAMYPAADIPVLQISIPSEDPLRLFRIGQALRPLREQGVLVIGSGFLTHGLPYTDMHRGADQPAPGWSREFDAWAAEALAKGDVETLMDYEKAPATRYAHPTLDHLVPMYITLGLASDPHAAVDPKIDGFWFGLSKRSFAVA